MRHSIKYKIIAKKMRETWQLLLLTIHLFFCFSWGLALVSFMYHPTALIILLCFCLHVYSDQLKPGNDISFCMILALVFFVCYVSDEVVSFGDSIRMRNVAQCKRFMQDIFHWFITKKLYDSVLHNALIKLLADHYTGDYNVELDFFSKTLYLSFIQVPVNIKSKS